tara:strand:- start:24013 stop:24363 length:351 start_codon:yes stop_codon:yes gene_type:complete
LTQQVISPVAGGGKRATVVHIADSRSKYGRRIGRLYLDGPDLLSHLPSNQRRGRLAVWRTKGHPSHPLTFLANRRASKSWGDLPLSRSRAALHAPGDPNAHVRRPKATASPYIQDM